MATWRAIEAVPVFLMWVGSIALVGSVVAGLASGKAAELAVGAAAEVLQGGVVVLWIWLLHRDAIRAIGPPERPLRDVIEGFVGGLATWLIAFFGALTIVTLVFELIAGHPPRAPEQLPEALRGGELVLAGFVVILLAPLGEELFFRGFLFRALRARRGFWLAAIVSSAAFGLVHYVDGSWLLVFPLFVVGVCLAFVYERRGSILAPIVAHATFNVIGFAFTVAGQ